MSNRWNRYDSNKQYFDEVNVIEEAKCQMHLVNKINYSIIYSTVDFEALLEDLEWKMSKSLHHHLFNC